MIKRKSLSLLIKPASGNCNLQCKYCFYLDVIKKREIESFGMMKEEVLEELVKKAYSYVDNFVTFAFQGGEPLLRGIEFFYSLIEYINKYNVNKVKTTFSVQTNGTLINKEWAEFFKKHSFLVGISLDGSSLTHDLHRVDANNKGSFKSVQEGIKILDDYSVDYNILCVVTKAIAKSSVKTYNFFKAKNYKYIQFIPCLDGLGDIPGGNSYSLTPSDYGKFLINIFDIWYKDILNNKYTSVRMLDNLVMILKGRQPESCDLRGVCSKGTVIEADGSLYPCDFYVVDKWKIGNIMDEDFSALIANKKMDEFVESSMNISDDCKNCKYAFICRGGCRRHKEPAINGQPLSNYFCESYKAFYDHALDGLYHIAKTL